MRYYLLELMPHGTSKPVYSWTSYPGGLADSSAQLIEFDAMVAPMGAPLGTGQRITVHGVSLSTLSQSQQFADLAAPWSAKLTVGFRSGLPLADSSHNGVAFQGTVVQSYGNWIGTEMSLTLIVAAGGPYDLSHPGNFTLLWTKGQSLADSLHSTLDPIYGASSVSITIGSSYASDWNKLHRARTLGGLARWVANDTLHDDDGPITIVDSAGQIRVYDKTAPVTSHTIDWVDLIGQPTWIAQDTLSVQLIMRGDLRVGDHLEFPKTINGNTPTSGVGLVSTQLPGMASIKFKSTFQSTYLIAGLRYIGNSRSSDSSQWSVVARCFALGS